MIPKELQLPQGLFSRDFEQMVQDTANDVQKVPHYKLLSLFAMLGHAKILLISQLPASAQVKDVSNEAPLWDKYSSIVSQLLQSKGIKHY